MNCVDPIRKVGFALSATVHRVLSEISEAYSACTACADLGLPADSRRAKYAALARAHLPPKVRVLFVAESAPAQNKRGRHSFFYLPEDDPQSQDPSVLF